MSVQPLPVLASEGPNAEAVFGPEVPSESDRAAGFRAEVLRKRLPGRRLPPWLKKPLPRGNEGFFTHQLLRELRLETVCENSRCPNLPECYSRRTATFMILGNVCTRPCGFCAVARGRPLPVEADEPERLAEAARRLGLNHVVITSVTRDDLPDGGAEQFYRCIVAVRRVTGATVEVLTPDFLGDWRAVARVLEAAPEVYNHNLETVPRLYPRVRGRADYRRSLQLLA
ncbi:MAG: lipoyl synthase, partial [Gemmatales bacterium]|nr:lipoyl synthase [Gemmatales bacterium]MDW8176055.1 lipoyl synthase [Gemmatales bacterium]